MASTSTTIPGRSSDCSVSSSAASRVIPRSIGTRSYGDPWNACSRCRRSDTSPPVIRATRARIRLADGPGRSAGRTFTVHDGVLTATGRPARSKINPRGAGTGTSTVRSAAARRANSSPCTTCSWKRRPPSAVMSTIAATPNAMNRGPERGRSRRPSFRSGMSSPCRRLVSDVASRNEASGVQQEPGDRRIQRCGGEDQVDRNRGAARFGDELGDAERDEVGDDRRRRTWRRSGRSIRHGRSRARHRRPSPTRRASRAGSTRAERPRADWRSNRP